MYYDAISLYDSHNRIVQEADEIIKYVDRRAEYYAEYNDWCEYYTPTDSTSNDWCYLINGKKYSLSFTSKRKDILSHMTKPRQLELEI